MTEFTLLDGGLGQELIARAGRATPLWSLQALIDAPDLVRAVHDDFFAAGADVATTDTYAVLPDRMDAFGMPERLEDLTRAACEIAARSRDAAGRGVVAGALGPLGFSYRPDLAPPAAEAAETYAYIARLQAPFVEVHLAETMSSVDQARGALMGMAVTGKPRWLALSVMDEDGTRLRSGEALDEVLPLLAEDPPDRVLLNCSFPEAITDGLPILARAGLPTGAYANGFTGISSEFDKIGASVDALSGRDDLGPEAYAAHALRWRAAGAATIGGCCQISPAHIAELNRVLR